MLRKLRSFGLGFLVLMDAALSSSNHDARDRSARGLSYDPTVPISGVGMIIFLVGSALAVAVIWRSRRPVELAGAGAAATFFAALGPTGALIGLMSVVRLKSRGQVFAVGLPVAAATFVRTWDDMAAHPPQASFWASLFAQDGEPISGWTRLVVAAILLGGFVGMGLWLRTRAQLADAHEVVEVERQHVSTLTDQVSRQAERERLAREIHDGLGHNLSILSLHANALQSMADSTVDPESGAGPPVDRLKQSAQVVQETAARSVSELHSLLGLLRNPEDPDIAAPTKTLRDVRALIDESVTAGMPLIATLFVDDSEAADPHIAQAAYRIVQELLTNARTHVPTIPVRLELQGGPADTALFITTANHLPHPDRSQPDARRARAGTGLSGIRERVEHYGGDMSSGVDAQGVFRVSIRLPWTLPDPTRDAVRPR